MYWSFDKIFIFVEILSQKRNYSVFFYTDLLHDHSETLRVLQQISTTTNKIIVFSIKFY